MTSRRSFMKSILAAGVAPYVVTAAGVLMPVRELARPIRIHRGNCDGVVMSIRFRPNGGLPPIRETSYDGKAWTPDEIDPQRVIAGLIELNPGALLVGGTLIINTVRASDSPICVNGLLQKP